jgi:hypothetical protein
MRLHPEKCCDVGISPYYVSLCKFYSILFRSGVFGRFEQAWAHISRDDHVWHPAGQGTELIPEPAVKSLMEKAVASGSKLGTAGGWETDFP